MFAQLFVVLFYFYGFIECQNWPQDAAVSDGDKFNYIVVGAGSGGAVVASRLSEVENLSVLLLEAGGNPPNASIFPGLLGGLMGSESDWSYTSQKDETVFLGLKNPGLLPISRGKMLGGTSSFNFMTYARGYPEDYNSWANLGFKGWDWESVFPYFLKSEGLQDQIILANSQYRPFHNTSGPMKISRELNRSAQINEKIDVLLQSFSEIGVNALEDYSDPSEMGICRTLLTHSEDGIRSSTAQAFLTNKRNNLSVVKQAIVSKVLFNDNTAIGVEVVINGEILNVFASNEVILSAGTFNTPKILVSSGVGPCEDIKKLSPQVPLVADLPVGKGLQDHLMLILGFTGGKTDLYEEDLSNSLAYLPFPALNGFLSLSNGPTPDAQIYAFYFNESSTLVQGALDILGYNDDLANSILKANEDKEIVILFLVLLHPKSRGSVDITSSDLNAQPEINLRYFSDPEGEDLNNVIKMIRRIANITNTSYFGSVNSEIMKVDIPACDEFEYFSDDFLTCYIRYMTQSIYHPVGTCAMGKVVDEDFKVYGINNLRIVDGSVMPLMTSSNTNAPIIMMAEKISDAIKSNLNEELL